MNTEKRSMLVVRATAEDKQALEKLAARLGYLHGDRPNVSGLIRAIAAGEIILTPLASVVSPRVSRRPLNRSQRRASQSRRSPRQ